MSLLVLTPETVWNRGSLEFSTAPRKILERGMILPRREFTWRLLARIILENQVIRFSTALLPFVVAMLIWRDLALPISQAPVLMFLVVGLVEMKVLHIPRDKRDHVTTEDAAARALDMLAYRGRRILAQIAATRSVQTGVLYLVVEQSELARVPPLTVVSVQADHGTPRLVPLSAAEREIVRHGLFDAEFTEQHLLKANLRDGVGIRSVAFEARGVSAHARLAALLEKPQDVPEAAT